MEPGCSAQRRLLWCRMDGFQISAFLVATASDDAKDRAQIMPLSSRKIWFFFHLAVLLLDGESLIMSLDNIAGEEGRRAHE